MTLIPSNKGMEIIEQEVVKKKCLIFQEEVASLMKREESLDDAFGGI